MINKESSKIKQITVFFKKKSRKSWIGEVNIIPRQR